MLVQTRFEVFRITALLALVWGLWCIQLHVVSLGRVAM